MSQVQDTKKCSRCARTAAKRRNQANYCLLHYRILQMRHDAATDNKTVPSWEQLEALFGITKMRCSACDRKMNFLSAQGRSTVVTLQHDHDSSFRLLCLACNVRHQFCPNDTFYVIPADSKYCPGCKTVKPRIEFYRHRSNSHGLCTRCKICSVREAVCFKQIQRGTFVGPMPQVSK